MKFFLFSLTIVVGLFSFKGAIIGSEKNSPPITKVDQLKKTIAGLEEELVQAVKEEEKSYQWIKELQETLVSLKQKEEENISSLKQQQQKVSKLLRAFKTLSSNNSLVILASCKSREDLIYTGILLKKTIKQLKEISLDLRQELSEIENSREQMVFTQENLSQTVKTLSTKKNNLESQLKSHIAKLKEMIRMETEESAGKKSQNSLKNVETPKVSENAKDSVSTIKKMTFSWPLQGKLIGPYGSYPEFFLKGKGIVVEVEKTAPVFSPQEGIVTRITENTAVGYIIVITHHEGFQTILCGVDSLHCYQGQKLQKGQILGIVEGTILKNPQLYIQLKCYGRWENPLSFYSKD